MSKGVSLDPVNRHLKVDFAEEAIKSESGVLLPDDFTEKVNKYKKVKLLAAAQDCRDCFRECVGRDIVVEKSMIVDVTLPGGKEVFLILENYVIGIVQK